MYRTVIVPLDGSETSARALVPAAVVAIAADAELHAVSFARSDAEVPELAQTISDQTSRLAPEATLVRTVVATDRPVADEVAALVEERPGALVVMSSLGRSRSGALGSVAEAVLRQVFGPILLVGPNARVDSFGMKGRIAGTIDGSALAQTVVPVVASWAISFDLEPWLIEVVTGTPILTGPGDVGLETNEVARIARDYSRRTGHEFEYDVLHGNPADAIVTWAQDESVMVLAMSTHGATGLARLAAGSVTMRVVHHAPCPVLVERPPHLQ